MPQHRPTILQIIPRLDIGGAERTTVEITEAIVTAGGRALVVAEGGRLVPQITQAGGEFIAMDAASKNPLTILGNARKLQRLIAQENVDLLHARSRAPAWSALMAARRTQKPFVTTYHGAYSVNGYLKRTYSSIMARGDIVIANSNFIADTIRSRFGTPEARMRIIYRGIDDGFDPARVSSERVEQLRTAWGVAPDQRVILHAARMTTRKGQSVLIGAAAAIVSQPSIPDDWIVILAGDQGGRDDYIEALKRQIATAGLQDRVRLVGRVDDMPAAYLAAQVAIAASSEPEAFGRVAAEAEAMGCPVIATRVGGAPEAVRAEPEFGPDEMTGWLVPPGDVPALAEKLTIALRLSNDQRAAIGARARQFITQSFTLAAMQQATLRVYDELLGSQLANQARS
ncbi:glycosyltransferase family 4 protein [Leptospira interrogans]